MSIAHGGEYYVYLTCVQTHTHLRSHIYHTHISHTDSHTSHTSYTHIRSHIDHTHISCIDLTHKFHTQMILHTFHTEEP